MNVRLNAPPVSQRRYETPLDAATAQVRRFSVEEYHQLIRSGLLDEDEPYELLEGWIVRKMPNDPVHAATVSIVAQLLRERLPEGYCLREQAPTTTADSEPEPGVAIARGTLADFLSHHPAPEDLVLVVEVSNTSLGRDREWKRRVYARARVPEYWILDLNQRQIERLTQPSADTTEPDYGAREVFGMNGEIPLPIPGGGSIAVGRIFGHLRS